MDAESAAIRESFVKLGSIWIAKAFDDGILPDNEIPNDLTIRKVVRHAEERLGGFNYPLSRARAEIIVRYALLRLDGDQ